MKLFLLSFRYRRLSLQQENSENGFAEPEVKRDELEAVERLIHNHRDLLRQVTSYPNRKLKQPDFLPYDPADSLTDPIVLLPPQPGSSLSTSPSCRSEHHLKPLQELCNAYFLSLMKDQLVDTERRLRGDRSILQTSHAIHSLSRRLTLTNFLFELWSSEEAEEEERESPEMELQSATASKKGAEAFQSEPQSIETFFSCVEEISIKLEEGEASMMTPDSSAATEMTGSVSSGDSIEILGTEKSFRTQRDVAGCDSRGVSFYRVQESQVRSDTHIKRAAADTGVRHVQAFARRANSEDSIEVLSTTESIFPDDLTAITEEEAEHQPLTNGIGNEDYKYDKVFKEEKTLSSGNEEESKEAFQEEEGCLDRDEPSQEIIASTGVVVKEEVNAIKRTEVTDDNSLKSSQLLPGNTSTT